MMKYLTDDDDILDIGLSFMKAIGECNGLRPVLLNMFRIFNIFTIIFTLWFTTANLSHANGVELLKTTEGISTTVHVSKINIFCLYLNGINALLSSIRLTLT